MMGHGTTGRGTMGGGTVGAPATRATTIRPRRRARAGDLLLADLLERELRAPLGRVAVVVRLSCLPAPGARPYHRRIARALLEDCAQRYGGQVFQLGAGDLALLTVPPAGDPQGGPLALPPLLTRLLRTEDGTPDSIAEAIPLAAGRARLEALLAAAEDADDAEPAPEDPYAAEPGASSPDRPQPHPANRLPIPIVPSHAGITRMTTAAPPSPARSRNIFARRTPTNPEPAASPDPGDTAALALHGGIAPLLQFQTTARLPPRGAAPATPIRPVHRALRLVPALLAARLLAHTPNQSPPTLDQPPSGQPPSGLPTDPWLRQHLANSLAAALLAALQDGWGSAGPLDPTPRRTAPPLLLALPPAVINGTGCAAFAARIRAAEPPPAPSLVHAHAPRVAISMAEASADPDGFAAARTRLRAAGMLLVLDGLTHHSLLLARPEALEPDLLSLAWSTALPRLPDARRDEIAAAVQRIGPERIILTGADSEAALRWGRATGIQMFQGSHAEAMLAASRLVQCPGAVACPLRVCAERATATSAAGRAGCTNPRLLDQGVPNPVHEVPIHDLPGPVSP